MPVMLKFLEFNSYHLLIHTLILTAKKAFAFALGSIAIDIRREYNYMRISG